MTDPLAGQSSASATAPAEATDIEKIKAEISAAMRAELDTRVAGFQRLLAGRDETIGALSQELDELKTAGLSEEEREQLRDDRLATENQELRDQLALAKLAPEYADEMPLFQELLEATDPKAQLEVLRKIRKPGVAAAPAAADAEPATPEIDHNNPPRQTPEGVTLPDGTLMTDDLADRVLGSVRIQADVTQEGWRSRQQ